MEKKPIYKKWWFWVAIVLVIGGIAGAGAGTGGKNADDKKARGQNTQIEDNSKDDAQEPITEEEKEDFSAVEKEYTLTAGYYTAGIDLPIGKCNLVALDGTGNVSSSNMFNGGLNEMFGVDNSTDLYISEFNGLKMDEKVVLSISGDVSVQLTYTEVTGDMSGREYDETAAVELSSGNYTAGTDFPGGIYNIVAVNGKGNLSSSNLLDGGVNEMFGIDDGSGLYVSEVKNIELKDGVELQISGVDVKLIPAKE